VVSTELFLNYLEEAICRLPPCQYTNPGSNRRSLRQLYRTRPLSSDSLYYEMLSQRIAFRMFTFSVSIRNWSSRLVPSMSPRDVSWQPMTRTWLSWMRHRHVLLASALVILFRCAQPLIPTCASL